MYVIYKINWQNLFLGLFLRKPMDWRARDFTVTAGMKDDRFMNEWVFDLTAVIEGWMRLTGMIYLSINGNYKEAA